jgi:hypothetical protein
LIISSHERFPFPHEDGEGYNILLQAMPVDGKLVLRTYQEREEEQQEITRRAKANKK